MTTAQRKVWQIEFRDHVHAQGRRNWTVRLGDKWLKRLQVGDVVWLADAFVGEQTRLNARIERVMTVPLKLVPDEILLAHHSGSKSRHRLLVDLRTVYGGVTEDSPVTCIAYFLIP